MGHGPWAWHAPSQPASQPASQPVSQSARSQLRASDRTPPAIIWRGETGERWPAGGFASLAAIRAHNCSPARCWAGAGAPPIHGLRRRGRGCGACVLAAGVQSRRCTTGRSGGQAGRPGLAACVGVCGCLWVSVWCVWCVWACARVAASGVHG